MDIELFEETLLRRCKPYLKDFKAVYHSGTKKVLRRGLPFSIDDDVKELSVNKNRRPMNTLDIIHDAANDWFFKNFGVHARSGSVFTTSVKAQAKEYGIPYMIFPVGKYEIIYSPKVHDLFQYLTPQHIVLNVEGERLNQLESQNRIKTYDESVVNSAVHSMLDNADYRHGSDLLGEALESKNEIMIICDKYYIASDANPAVMDFLQDVIRGMV